MSDETTLLAQQAAALLQRCTYANIATIGADGPWNTPVTAMVDTALKVYWASWVKAQHSRHIETDPRVFLTFYDSTRARGTNHRGCVYLKARAARITQAAAMRQAHALIYPDTAWQEGTFTDRGPRCFYCAEIQAVWLNDLSERQVTQTTRTMRVAVPLQALRAALEA